MDARAATTAVVPNRPAHGASRVEVIGDATLYLGDCRDVLPSLAPVDAVITDPPYGLGDRLATRVGEWAQQFGARLEWDRETVPDGVVEGLAKYPIAIIWGGNYYPLPSVRGWLLWDKMQEHSSGHAEMAWTNLDIPIRTFRYARAQLANEGKLHPTQKPLPLMIWCVAFAENARTVLDPFMGSGTTGVACVDLGRSFVGIEREPKFFDIACRRIDAATRQGRLLP